MAVNEGFALAVIGIKGVVDRLGRHGDGHGQVASRKAFGDRHNVRRDAGVIAGKHAPGTAKTCGDFVGDEKHPRLVAKFTELFEVERRIDPHSGAPLEKRLDDDRRRFFSVRGESFFRVLETLTLAVAAILAIGTAEAVGRLDVDVLHHHRLIHLRVKVQAPHGQGPDRLAVVAFGKAHEFLPLRMARLQMVLKAHLEPRLDRRRAVIIKVELRQSLRHDSRQFLRQPDRRLIGKIRENNVFQAVNLLFDRLIDDRIAMAKEIAPPRADDVEIFFAVDIVQPYALRPFDDHGRQFLVILHLRRRVPDILQIAAFPVFDFFSHRSFRSRCHKFTARDG